MTGPERDLTRLIAGMRPVLDPETYVFATVPQGEPAPAVNALMRFEEAEGTTLILRDEDAAGLTVSFPCRRITLTVHSALDAVGFLAAVAAPLSAAGISTNAVAAFYHDHLFVPRDRADDAIAVLTAMAKAARLG